MSQWVDGRVLHIDVDLDTSSQTIEVELEGGGKGILPYYDGVYKVDPRKVEQTLATENKSMRDDVVIHPIFYAETSNVSGGLTAVIGLE